MLMAWSAWDLDHLTWGWIAWIVFFVGWETYSLVVHPGQELTAHLRPLFNAAPVTWFLAFGLWLWIGIHFLSPALEHEILKLLRGY
jgi:hypothetical protein